MFDESFFSKSKLHATCCITSKALDWIRYFKSVELPLQMYSRLFSFDTISSICNITETEFEFVHKYLYTLCKE